MLKTLGTTIVAIAVMLPMVLAPAALAQSKDAALVMDAQTGKILYERNGSATRFPASLTKIMTLYLLFEQIAQGKMTLKTPLKVSAEAARQPPTKLNLKPGDTIPVEKAIEALIVRSANDVAVVVAEAIAGSEQRFARLMTQKARSLKMRNTSFFNASGLPNLYQRSTARDMAILGRAVMRDFPQFYHYFSRTSFTYRGVSYETHNDLLFDFGGANGIKTGYTRASGFNLVSSVERDGRRIIGVVMGGTTARERDWEMREMLTSMFKRIEDKPTLVAVYKAPAAGEAPVALAALDPETVVRDARPRPKPGNVVAMAPIPDDTGEAEAVSGVPAPRPNPQRVADLRMNIDPGAKPAFAAREAVAGRNPPVAEMPIAQASLGPVVGLSEGDSAGADRRRPTLGTRAWGIQIGAYRDRETAANQVRTIARTAPEVLKGAEAVVTPYETPEGTLFRARFGPFKPDDARRACAALEKRGLACLAVADGDWAIADATP